MKNLLFICTSNMDRSPKAEELFKDNPNYEAKSCGLSPVEHGTKVSKELLDWANIIFCMEHEHKQFIIDNFDVDVNKIVVLNIPNTYAFGDPKLEELLRIKLKEWLKNAIKKEED